jgi:hypothetical protein
LDNYADASIRRYAPPVKTTDLSFEFILLFDGFTTKEQAFEYSREVESSLMLNTKVLLDENKETYFVTSELMEGWSRINDLKDRVINSGVSAEPVILMVEIKNQ